MVCNVSFSTYILQEYRLPRSACCRFAASNWCPGLVSSQYFDFNQVHVPLPNWFKNRTFPPPAQLLSSKSVLLISRNEVCMEVTCNCLMTAVICQGKTAFKVKVYARQRPARIKRTDPTVIAETESEYHWSRPQEQQLAFMSHVHLEGNCLSKGMHLGAVSRRTPAVAGVLDQESGRVPVPSYHISIQKLTWTQACIIKAVNAAGGQAVHSALRCVCLRTSDLCCKGCVNVRVSPSAV
eukprot:204193-Pelagomonas_calceolata.AAC.11